VDVPPDTAAGFGFLYVNNGVNTKIGVKVGYGWDAQGNEVKLRQDLSSLPILRVNFGFNSAPFTLIVYVYSALHGLYWKFAENTVDGNVSPFSRDYDLHAFQPLDDSTQPPVSTHFVDIFGNVSFIVFLASNSTSYGANNFSIASIEALLHPVLRCLLCCQIL
jgi:hypothetical protein